MVWFRQYAASTVGRKQVMAITGILMVGFLLAHLAGNLAVFAGRDAMNSYAVKLRELGPLLWIMRGGLVAVFLVHVFAALSLAAQNRAARASRYRVFRPQRTAWYTRMMMLSGLLLLAYLAYHLAHFTFGFTVEGFDVPDDQGRFDVYGMVIAAFKNKVLSLFYVAAMFVLSAHLAHALPSFFQTLGLNHPKYRRIIEGSGPLVGVILFVGYSSIPVAILTGVIGS